MHLGSFLMTTDYYQKGEQLMSYALKLGAENSSPVVKAKVLGYYDHICAHFCYNVNTEFRYFQEAYDDCFREGDSEQGVFFLVRSMLGNVYFGHSLDMLQNRLKTKTSELLQFYKAKSSIEEYYYLLHQFVAHLKGTEDLPETLEFWNLKGYASNAINSAAEDKNNGNDPHGKGGDDYGYYRFLRSTIQMMVDFFMGYDKYEDSLREFQSAPMHFFDTLSSCDMIWAMFFECLLLCRQEYRKLEKVYRNAHGKTGTALDSIVSSYSKCECRT